MGGHGTHPGVCLSGPKILQAGGGAGGGTAASGWRMMDAGGPGPVMAVAGQRRRTYHPGPLTLGVSLRSGRDNRGNFTPMGVGARGSR